VTSLTGVSTTNSLKTRSSRSYAGLPLSEFESGTLAVRAEEVVSYIESVEDDYPTLRERSESTIDEAATKYLTALRNFGLLEERNAKSSQ